MTATRAPAEPALLGSRGHCRRCGTPWSAMPAGVRFCTRCGEPAARLPVAGRPLGELAVLDQGRRAIDGAPSVGRARFELGLAEARAGRWEAAVRHLHRTLEHPADVPPVSVHAALAVASAKLGRKPDEARHALQAMALSRTVGRTEVTATLTAVLSLDDIAPVKSSARTLAQPTSACPGLGVVLLALAGAPDEALAAARSLPPSSARSVRWAVQHVLAQHDADRVPAFVREESWLGLAEVAALAGGARLAARCARIALQSAGADDRIAARAHVQLGQSVRTTRQRADHLFQAARRFLDLGETDSAARLFAEVDSLTPGRQHVLWLWAEAVRRMCVLPEPQPLDAHRLAESADIWDRAASLGPPEPRHSWAYYTRALLSEGFAQQDPTAARDHQWNALTHYTLALSVRPDDLDLWGWAQLNRCLSAVGAVDAAANAMCAALDLALGAEAGSLSDLDVEAVLQEALEWASSRRPDMVGGLLATARERLPDRGAWLHLVEGWHLARAGEPARALEAFRRARQGDVSGLTGAFGLARTLLVAGERDDGRAEAERLWARLQEDASEGPGIAPEWVNAQAWSAMWTGRDDEAERLAGQYLGSPRDERSARADMLVLRGLCEVRRGDLAAAQRSWDAVLALPAPAGVLADFPLDALFVADDPTEAGLRSCAPAVVDLVRRYRRRFRAAYRRAVAGPPEADLDRALEDLAARARTGPESAGPAALRVGVFLLARAGRWREAHARALLARRARTAYASTLVGWTRGRIADELVAAIVQAPPAEVGAVLRSFRSSGLRLLEAAEALRPALSAAQYWALVDLCREGRPGSFVEAVTRTLEDWPERYLGGRTPYPAPPPEPLPVALELGEDLVPADAVDNWQEWELFTRMIPEMRERVRGAVGFAAPGVRVRPNPAFRPLEYAVLLDEVQVDGDVLPADDALELAVARAGEQLVRASRRFVGPDDVAALVEGRDGDTPPDACPTDDLLTVTAVVRELLADGVAVGRHHVETAGRVRGPMDERLAAVRLTHRGDLPGNRPGVRRHLLDAAWEATVGVDGAVLAPPGATWEVLRALRELDAADPARPLVVVTSRPELRRPLQRLLDAAGPDLPVLTLEECDDR